MTTTTKQATAAALAAELREQRREEKAGRRREVLAEVERLKGERDRLHRDDAPAERLAALRRTMRDLEDEADGLAGADRLLADEIEAAKARHRAALGREAGAAADAAVAAMKDAHEQLNAAILRTAETLQPLHAKAVEAGKAARLAELEAHRVRGEELSPLSPANVAVRPYRTSLELAELLARYARDGRLPQITLGTIVGRSRGTGASGDSPALR